MSPKKNYKIKLLLILNMEIGLYINEGPQEFAKFSYYVYN